MKRDMEYVRELLLKIEAAPTLIKDSHELKSSREEELKLHYHLEMLIDHVGFVSGIPAHHMQGQQWLHLQLTWQGHEFLESVRDPEVWARTMAGAKKAGNWGLEFVVDLAKAYAKHVAKERLGIDI